MAELINSPAKKMLFRRRSPSDAIIAAQFPDPKTGRLSPNTGSIASSHAFTSTSDPFPYTTPPPPPPPPPHHRQPIERTQSSEYLLEIQRGQPTRGGAPSRRSNLNTTIHTDATETLPAFKSDAFAVEMPTTREPILETLPPPPVFRARIPKVASPPSRAQVEAYQTYKQKAEQVRERNNSTGVRVPSKIVSYDYAYQSSKEQNPRSPTYNLQNPPDPTPLQQYIDSMTPNTPPRYSKSPAGSFPISPPPIPQTSSWPSPKARQQQPPIATTKAQSPQPRANPNHHPTTNNTHRRPLILGNLASLPPLSTAAQPDHHHHHHRASARRGDTETGATPPPLPTAKKPITVRLKPKPTVVPAAIPRQRRTSSSPEEQEEEQHKPLRKQSHWHTYNSNPSPLPPPPPPRFAFTTNTPATTTNDDNTVSGSDAAIFDHANTNINHNTYTSAAAGSAPPTTTPPQRKDHHLHHPPRYQHGTSTTPTKPSKKDHLLSSSSSSSSRKWGGGGGGGSVAFWLRPSGPRVGKLLSSTTTTTTTTSSFPSPPSSLTNAPPIAAIEKTTTVPTTNLFFSPITTTRTTPPPPPPRHKTSPLFPPTPPLSPHPHPRPRLRPTTKKHTSPQQIQTGLTQLTHLTHLVLRIIAVVYLLVLTFYILDAIRQCLEGVGAGVRAVRWVVEEGVVWVVGGVGGRLGVW
ncbi:hypothetical protein DM02DRAFT_732455 [Periconia macrospinosa]|uniref:Uncharacterized protein n=1 Tax=Periconia macrospinosa TaxID=97972 RepID=A0A2V1D901_9PLEO|nr:hypothetical protein DM02DRAFT_732455 [Periconia macrospinosa]